MLQENIFIQALVNNLQTDNRWLNNTEETCVDNSLCITELRGFSFDACRSSTQFATPGETERALLYIKKISNSEM